MPSIIPQETITLVAKLIREQASVDDLLRHPQLDELGLAYVAEQFVLGFRYDDAITLIDNGVCAISAIGVAEQLKPDLIAPLRDAELRYFRKVYQADPEAWRARRQDMITKLQSLGRSQDRINDVLDMTGHGLNVPE